MRDIDNFYWNEETRSYQRWDEASPFDNADKWRSKESKELAKVLDRMRERVR